MFVYNEFGSIDFGHTVGKCNLLYNEFGSIDFGHTVGKYNILEISMYLITIRRSNIILNLLF